MLAARDKRAHTRPSYPGGSLCRDERGNTHESYKCGTDPPECREKQTPAGAFDKRGQARLTLDIPPHSKQIPDLGLNGDVTIRLHRKTPGHVRQEYRPCFLESRYEQSVSDSIGW